MEQTFILDLSMIKLLRTIDLADGRMTVDSFEIRRLWDMGFIEVDDYDGLYLTEIGAAITRRDVGSTAPDPSLYPGVPDRLISTHVELPDGSGCHLYCVKMGKDIHTARVKLYRSLRKFFSRISKIFDFCVDPPQELLSRH